MEEKHPDKVYSINPDGQLCIEGQELDSDMVLYEEEAKKLFESELMESLLFYYPEDEEDYSDIEDEDLDQNTENNSKDNEVTKADNDYFDINNDEFYLNY